MWWFVSGRGSVTQTTRMLSATMPGSSFNSLGPTAARDASSGSTTATRAPRARSSSTERSTGTSLGNGSATPIGTITRTREAPVARSALATERTPP
jgi:hypothetical protein